MSEALARRAAPEPLDNTTLTAVVTDGDCSKLNETQRRDYYLARCDAAGLDPRTAPFMFTKLNNKLVLYALKSATDQLASNNRVVTTIISRETVEGVYAVTVRATAADGRSTEDVGAVPIGGVKGENLANALMKAVTKAKRRAILSLCGLGMTDETELDTIPAAAKVAALPPSQPAIRGVVPDEAPPVADPPHDPATGETIGAEQVALYDELLLACADGFSAQPHKENWLNKHSAEIKALPRFARKEIQAAYEAASITAPEKKS